MFAFITLFFTYLPSSQVMRAVYGREAAGVITFLWGVVFLLTGLVLWPVFATGSSTGAMFSVGLVAFGMFTGVFGLTADPTYSAWKTLLRSSKFWRTFLTFPLILVISPWLIVLIKLRTILPYNIQVLRQKQVLALGESALEAAPQLAFQLYIVTTRSDRHDGVLYVLPRNHHLSAIARFPCLSPKLLKLLFPLGTTTKYTPTARWPSYFQWSAMMASLLSLAIPATEIFLANKNIHDKIPALKYWPVFFLNIVFRVFSLSVIGSACRILVILIFLMIVSILFLCGFTIECYNKTLSGQTLPLETDFRKQYFESFLLSFITITNLDNTRAAVFWRKVSSYSILVYYTVILLIIFIILIQEDNLEFLPNLPNATFLKILIIITISLGLTSLILDSLLSKCTACYISVFKLVPNLDWSNPERDIKNNKLLPENEDAINTEGLTESSRKDE